MWVGASLVRVIVDVPYIPNRIWASFGSLMTTSSVEKSHRTPIVDIYTAYTHKSIGHSRP
ncbi:MAG: hypothetical protein K6D59_01385 [Bacteroidales bacterium]|nr:hypothetical protein [Bacteroidales bacterium]